MCYLLILLCCWKGQNIQGEGRGNHETPNMPRYKIILKITFFSPNMSNFQHRVVRSVPWMWNRFFANIWKSIALIEHEVTPFFFCRVFHKIFIFETKESKIDFRMSNMRFFLEIQFQKSLLRREICRPDRVQQTAVPCSPVNFTIRNALRRSETIFFCKSGPRKTSRHRKSYLPTR